MTDERPSRRWEGLAGGLVLFGIEVAVVAALALTGLIAAFVALLLFG